MNGDGLKMGKPDYCPEWFDIARYDKLAEFSRHQLAYALYFRKLLPFKNCEESKKDLFLKYIKKSATEILENPPNHQNSSANGEFHPFITTEDSITEFKWIDVARLYADSYVLFPEMRHLFRESVTELEKCTDYFQKNPEEERSFWFAPTDMLPENTNTETISKIADFLEISIGQNHDYGDILHIDLYQSDEVLKEAFAVKLKELRAARAKPGKRISDAEIRKIVEYRVFAFIDLYLYSVFAGRKFTDWEMANMIYPPSHDTPPNFDAVDRIARTVRPKAMTLLKDTDPRLFL